MIRPYLTHSKINRTNIFAHIFMQLVSLKDVCLAFTLHKVSLYYHTLCHLTIRQILYRIYYLARLRILPKRAYVFDYSVLPSSIQSRTAFPLKNGKWLGMNQFKFLNIEHQFASDIDWEFPAYGRLWTFNLNYFDYLLDENCSEEEAFGLMSRYLEAEPGLKMGKLPYPVSLRVFNWLKAMVRFGRAEPKLLSFIRCDLRNLARNMEYHVMGNHLLENALALCFGGLALGDHFSLEKGLKVLREELVLQFLDDGAHHERSPMYQQILLERMLDCLNLCQCASEGQRLSVLLQPVVESMFAWLRGMTFSDGSISSMNDFAPSEAMTMQSLKDYAFSLGVDPFAKPVRMGASGYRRFDRSGFELVADAGDLGPDHLLAHAHSDTLSFCMNFKGRPIIVDTGVTTYDEGSIRQYERSTSAHNTVVVDDLEQSVTWGSFRVARRAHSSILNESDYYLQATHDGYNQFGIVHIRDFHLIDSGLYIQDRVIGGIEHHAFLHFAPGLEIDVINDDTISLKSLSVILEGSKRIEKKISYVSGGFNRKIESWKVKISFQSNLSISFLPK